MIFPFIPSRFFEMFRDFFEIFRDFLRFFELLRFSFKTFLLFLHFKSLIEILNLFGKSSIPKPLRCRVLNFFGEYLLQS